MTKHQFKFNFNQCLNIFDYSTLEMSQLIVRFVIVMKRGLPQRYLLTDFKRDERDSEQCSLPLNTAGAETLGESLLFKLNQLHTLNIHSSPHQQPYPNACHIYLLFKPSQQQIGIYSSLFMTISVQSYQLNNFMIQQPKATTPQQTQKQSPHQQQIPQQRQGPLLQERIAESYESCGPTLTLPAGWVSFDLFPSMKVFYNYHDKVFTFTPVMNSLDFLTEVAKLIQVDTRLHSSLKNDAPGHLNKILKEVEAEIRLRNDGQLPERPRSLSVQIEQLMEGQKKVVQAKGAESSGSAIGVSGELSVKKKKSYHTKVTAEKIKGIHKQTDEVSILMSVCTQSFQLQPNFTYEQDNRRCTALQASIYDAGGSSTTNTERSLPRSYGPGFPHKISKSKGSGKPGSPPSIYILQVLFISRDTCQD